VDEARDLGGDLRRAAAVGIFNANAPPANGWRTPSTAEDVLATPLCSFNPFNAFISAALLKRPDIDGLLHA